MNSSVDFGFEIVACALLGIIVWAACAGIGYRILPAAVAPRPEGSPPSWRQPGVAACVGLAALMMLGGIAVLFRIPWWLFVVPFLVAGIALAIRELSGVERRGVPRVVWIIGGAGVGALVLVAVTQALVGFRFPLAGCDDLRVYLPMARRLLGTNGLIEPWSTRRLQNLGGFTFLQALPVSVFGNVGIGVVETMLASIFLAGLFIGNGMRSTWARVLCVLLILSIPLLWVPRVNATGVLFGSPLLVAAFAITAELRGSLRNANRVAALRWAAAGGLLIAALFSVRPPLSVLAAGVIGLGALLAGGDGFRARLLTIGTAAAAAIVAIVPWALATWRSSGVLLYQLPVGNQNVAIVKDPPLDGVYDLLVRASDLVRAGPYPWIVLGVLVVAVAARRLVPDAPLLGIAAVATGVVVAGFAINLPFASELAFLRYVAPLPEGLAVFCLCEVMRGADARHGQATTCSPVWVPAVAVGASLCLFAAAYSVIGISSSTNYIPGGANLVRLAAENRLTVLPLDKLNVPGLERAYRRALQHAEGRTIAAVDRPYLIDYSRHDIPSLDLPGFAAPGGDFPFFTGPAAKVARLRAANYETLLATVPATDACLNPQAQQGLIALGLAPYNRWARYILDWDSDIEAIARRAPEAVQQFGPLLVVDLRKAQRQLAGTDDS